MVKYPPALDRTFTALSDPIRRALLTRLAERAGLSVSELAAPFPVSLPAIMKHLDVLSAAGLIAREKTGRTVCCRLTAAPMQEATAWLTRYEQFWSKSLDRLAMFLDGETSLEDEHSWTPKPSASRALPSSAVSTRHRRKSSRHGPTRKR